MSIDKMTNRGALYALLLSIDNVLDDGAEALSGAGLFDVPAEAMPDFDSYGSRFDVSGLRHEYDIDVRDAFEHELGVSSADDVERKLRRIRAILLGLLAGAETNTRVTELKPVYEARLGMYGDDMGECVEIAERALLDEVYLGEDFICGSLEGREDA